MLRDFRVTKFKIIVNPLPLNTKCHTDCSEPFSNPTQFRCLVGKLNFITHTRLDLSYSVNF